MVAYGVVTIWLYPVLIDPVFNKFERLPNGPLRADVLRLADRAGVNVGEVYRVDASRRTGAVNAYVNGLGHSKRVVLYDNLIDDFPRPEVLGVVAHELGHQKHDDLLRGLAWLAIVAPAGTFLAQALAERFAPRERLGGPGGLPAVALAIALVSLALGCASNALSRKVEASADSFSLELTRDPAEFIAFQRRIAIENVTDPDRPSLAPAVRHASDDAGADRRRRGVPLRQAAAARVASRLAERVIRELASYERPSASEGEHRAAERLAGEFRAAGCRDVRVEEARSGYGGRSAC